MFFFYFIDQTKRQHREVESVVQDHPAEPRSTGLTDTPSTCTVQLKLSASAELSRFALADVKGRCGGSI